jgi:hypothetical protein
MEGCNFVIETVGQENFRQNSQSHFNLGYLNSSADSSLISNLFIGLLTFITIGKP